MKKLVADRPRSPVSASPALPVWLGAHSSVVTPNGAVPRHHGNAAGRRQAPAPKQTWQNSLGGQQTADANNDVTQADAQCP